MSHGPELDRLAARWAEQPDSTCFAPLAEGLRKRGALAEAAAIALGGVAARPGYLPGHLVLARIYHDQERWDAAEVALQSALAIDRLHPVVREALGRLAARRETRSGGALAGGAGIGALEPRVAEDGDGEATDLVFSDEVAPDATPSPQELVVTESLAMLFWGQGHHQQAIDAFETLIRRHPDNPDFVARRDTVRAEFAAVRPVPFDSFQSGARGVRDWLAGVAAITAPPARPVSGFDAFYQTPVTETPAEPGDMAAFQAWLRELDR